MKFSSSLMIGTTSTGLQQPVFWDTHTQVFNNRPPVTCITGAPGSGKTFLAMTITAMSGMLGKKTVVLDPKGDFLSLYDMREEIGNVSFWNLSSSSSRGMLDPFFLTQRKGEKLQLVLTVVSMLLGGLSDEQQHVLSPIIQDVINSERASMMGLVARLRDNQNPKARYIGSSLNDIRQQPFAELCFRQGNRGQQNVSLSEGVTIISMVGLELPTAGSDSEEKSSVSGSKRRLSMTIFYLITDYLRRIMDNDDSPTPKTIIIDEAWAVVATHAGAEVVRQLALLGRSKNLALVLITQTLSHLTNLDVKNTIAVRFAFRTDHDDATEIINDMGLPTDEGFQTWITGLGKGECLMQMPDYRRDGDHKKYSKVKIRHTNRRWAEHFSTNPIERLQKQKRKEQQP